MREDRPDRAVQLAAAVTALRESAHLPPLPGSRTAALPGRRRRASASGRWPRLWAEGLTMTSADAAELALAAPESPPAAATRRLATRRAPARSGRPGPPAADRPLAAPGAGLPAGR